MPQIYRSFARAILSLRVLILKTYKTNCSPQNENLNLLFQIKFLNLFLYTV
jgi:hypothetical protein